MFVECKKNEWKDLSDPRYTYVFGGMDQYVYVYVSSKL